MSLSDIRQNQIISALLDLENERNANRQKDILKKLQNLFMSNINIFSLLKPYLNLQHDAHQKLQNEIETEISHVRNMEHHSIAKDFNGLFKILNEHKNNNLTKDIRYTQYLIACEEYHQKTGSQPSHDEVQSVNIKSKVKVSSVEKHNTRVHYASFNALETEKPPAFIDKRDYKDGGVRIYYGMKPGDLEKIDEEIAKELNSKYPGSIEFKKTERGHTLTILKQEICNEYEKLHEDKLEQKYKIFSHSTDKKEKDIPEKYHVEDDKKENINKLRL